MRVLTKRKIDRIAREAAKMEREILSARSYVVSEDLADELTEMIERIVKMTGGEVGYAQYSAHIVDHYTAKRKEEPQTRQMGKVIAVR